jgi:hypothetical protein
MAADAAAERLGIWRALAEAAGADVAQMRGHITHLEVRLNPSCSAAWFPHMHAPDAKKLEGLPSISPGMQGQPLHKT